MSQEERERERYGFPAALWRSLERRRPPALGEDAVAESVARAMADGCVRVGPAGVVAHRDHHRLVVLQRLRAPVRPGDADVGWLRLPWFDWTTRPSWLYRLTQGLHMGLGLVLIPVVLARAANARVRKTRTTISCQAPRILRP
jgi:hypothetical protein